MVKYKTKVDEYKAIFVRLHKYQRKGGDNLIQLLTRYIRGKADYMASYIDLVAERTGVSATCHITTTNKDIMFPIVHEVVTIKEGTAPKEKDLQSAWDAFIHDYRNNLIKY